MNALEKLSEDELEAVAGGGCGWFITDVVNTISKVCEFSTVF
ncbi:MAG: type A2 lantipeptide [Synergistaceae bacterium]|nr:type A2 lantipeptide [Synergistaceae bacterium]